MKKLFAIVLLVSAVAVIGCGETKKPAAKTAAPEAKPAAPAAAPAAPPAEKK